MSDMFESSELLALARDDDDFDDEALDDDLDEDDEDDTAPSETGATRPPQDQ